MSQKFIGCDLGGTNLRAGIVDLDTGQVSHLHSMPTLAREGPDVVMARMAELILDVISVAKLSKSDIGGIGIGVPGVLDLERGLTTLLTQSLRNLAKGTPSRYDRQRGWSTGNIAQ